MLGMNGAPTSLSLFSLACFLICCPLLRRQEGKSLQTGRTSGVATEVRQVHVYFFAQPAFRSDTAAVTDDQQAGHQLGIDRWPAGMTV